MRRLPPEALAAAREHALAAAEPYGHADGARFPARLVVALASG
jgi:hypothetical protein